VHVAGIVKINADDVARSVDAERERGGCAGEVQAEEIAFREDKPVLDKIDVAISAYDVSRRIDPVGQRIALSGNIDGGEDAAGLRKAAEGVGIEEPAGNLTAIVDANVKGGGQKSGFRTLIDGCELSVFEQETMETLVAAMVLPGDFSPVINPNRGSGKSIGYIEGSGNPIANNKPMAKAGKVNI